MKINLNNLSYNAYGNIVIATLLILSLLFTIFPFNFSRDFYYYLLMFGIYVLMIPIYLISRYKYGYELHLIGLNKCFIFTTSFYLMLDTLIYLIITYYGLLSAFIVGSIITCIATYFTSELTNIHEIKGKLFWGYKPKNASSKYADIEEYVKFNEFNPKLIKYENKLKEQDTKLYLIYKYRFKEKATFKTISERLDIETNRITEELDKIAFSIRIMKDI